MKKILIMAGGTGGHVFPALAVAQALQQQNIEVHWLGTPRGLENEIVPRVNIPLHHIDITGWRGKGLKKWLLAPFLLTRAVVQARKLIKTIDPDIVLGMGGFVSGPGGIAAKLLRKPLVIHEQNGIPGLTNRCLAWIANAVLEAFPHSFSRWHRGVFVTGNPVRDDIIKLPLPALRFTAHHGRLRLLVLGGSQGATVINHTIPNALSILSHEERPEIWHQAGKAGVEETRRFYQMLGLQAQIEPFIDDMAAAYAWADLVVCRAGALTVSELAAAGIGSILVPYPHSVDQHQVRNAEFLAKEKAAIIMLQQDFSAVRLAELLRKILQRDGLLMMAEAARKLYHGDATQKVVEICMQVGQKSKNIAEKIP